MASTETNDETNDEVDKQVAQQPVEILWEESTALVVNKPAGILTQGAAGIDTLETRLRNFLKVRDQHSGSPYVGLPHRIDRPVSGALLVARNLRAVQRFGAQFQSRKIEKIYWAMTSGHLDEATEMGLDANTQGAKEGWVSWQDYMRKIPDRPVAEIVDEGATGAKLAVLHFRLLKRLQTSEGEPRSLVEVRLETGRMHQIRLQFASRGWPLLGDSMYGSNVGFGPQVEDLRCKAIALHSRTICFRHPKSGVEVSVTAPLPRWNLHETDLERGQVDHCGQKPTALESAPHGWEVIGGL